ncbi:hypothetical protein FRC02_004275 [Tulasnella sp. 418]|nr:hypothetical protein FRC02_004275 [Tulasnella sp. 418]
MEETSADTLHSPISSLPSELLVMILEHVWGRVNSEVLNCSLVCSRWRPIAQRMIYTEAILTLEENASRFLDAVRGNPSLGRATKIINFRRSHRLVYSGTRPKPDQIKDIVSYCPRLYQLSLPIFSELNGEDLKAMVPSMVLPTLRALHIFIPLEEGESNELVLETQDILHFLHQFSSLSHLLMEDIHRLKPSSLNSGRPPPPSFQLYEFNWIGNNYHELESPFKKFCDVTDWLFERSPRGPRIFGLDERSFEVEVDMLHHLLKNYGKDLISLVTPAEVEYEDIPLSELCPDLRELILHFTDLPSPDARGTGPIAHLEHLGCKTPLFPDREPLIKTIDWLITIPNLRCVSLFEYHHTPDPDSYGADEWKERFQDKISLRALTTGDDFIERRDFIAADRFPREDGTVSNLEYMVIPSL